ncbi:hypothetical protein [Candidatus Brachybacter algidus]|nr:hypothetical protein [Candidatus Brachybacter algidus]
MSYFEKVLTAASIVSEFVSSSIGEVMCNNSTSASNGLQNPPL